MLNVRSEKVTIPTYEVGIPDQNPLFLDKRVYQASSGKIYPYPMIDKIYDEKIDKEYDVVVVENEYIEIMIMPTLGGRIQYGYDKQNDYYFFYHNEVIKPALVGLCGPWISGGVEFNWPQHHRPSTYDKVEHDIEYGEGYVIVWVNELEKMSQLIGVAGIKIYEDSNRVEVLGRSINNTNIPKTFLWWANIAVHCHQNYESFFPKDVRFVADHGKREATSYPYADSQYYNIDYPSYELEKRNITNYDNIRVPMSYMAVGSKYHFFGGYDFDKNIGTMHVSNTHTAPGKKQWTWGSGEFGKAWDRHLTDENGPYVELMAGVYTDNQPDFTWINPGETKEFKQTWYPFRTIGKALNADENIAYNIVAGNLIVFSTVNQQLNISIAYENGIIDTDNKDIKVGETVEYQLSPELKYTKIDINGLVFIVEDDEVSDFSPAIEAKLAQDLSSIDELYNIGIHLEQYRHATRSPIDYYKRILEIDNFDARANTRLGFINLEAGRLETAVLYFKVAIKTLTKYNPNPIDCSSLFGIATAYKLLSKDELAYKNFHKAIWDNKFKAKGYLELAKLDIKAGRYNKAIENLNESIKYDTTNLQSQVLIQRINEINNSEFSYSALIVDKPYNYYARYYNGINEFLKYIGQNDKTIIEMVEFLTEIGSINEAKELILKSKTEHPVLKAYLINNGEELDNSFLIAGYFPYTVFERLILEEYLMSRQSCELEYLLSILLIDKSEKDIAFELLSNCYQKGYKNSMFLRVYALCEFNVNKDYDKAVKLYLEAINQNPKDTRLVYEFDQLKKILNYDPQGRLDYLKEHREMVEYRDDLKAEYAWLLCQLKHYDECIKYMESSKFHPFEGGEGKVIEVYKTAKLAIAIQYIENLQYEEAFQILNEINQIPDCLGEAIIEGTPNADVLYYQGICYEAMQMPGMATEMFELCANEQVITTSKLSYKPEKLQMNYFQALANAKLGDEVRKVEIIDELENIATEKIKINAQIDYFAISVPEFSIFDVDLNIINKAHCYYLLALCEKAKGNLKESQSYIKKSKELNRNKLEVILN